MSGIFGSCLKMPFVKKHTHTHTHARTQTFGFNMALGKYQRHAAWTEDEVVEGLPDRSKDRASETSFPGQRK